MTSGCKILEKCKKCKCKTTQAVGLSEKLDKYRPTERVIERQIVELAQRCEMCDCQNKEAEGAN